MRDLSRIQGGSQILEYRKPKQQTNHLPSQVRHTITLSPALLCSYPRPTAKASLLPTLFHQAANPFGCQALDWRRTRAKSLQMQQMRPSQNATSNYFGMLSWQSSSSTCAQWTERMRLLASAGAKCAWDDLAKERSN